MQTTAYDPAALARIEKWLAEGKAKQAIELAKAEHKRLNSAESGDVLLRAYLVRIGEFQSKGMAENADLLIKLVKERFPGSSAAVRSLELKSVVGSDDVNRWVAPLAHPDVEEPLREIVHEAIRTRLLDLPALATARSLPDQHPLKVDAAAVLAAFNAVTTGPVTDEQIALPGISRRHPLAAWKLLLRAVASLHRLDDAGAVRAAEAIPADSALARAGGLFRSLTKGPPPTKPMAAALTVHLADETEALLAEVKKLDEAFHSKSHGNLQTLLGNVRRRTGLFDPQLLVKFNRVIAARMLVAGENPRTVIRDVPVDAALWRTVANGLFEVGLFASAVTAFKLLLHHTRAENLTAAGSIEESIIFRKIARAAGIQYRERSPQIFYPEELQKLYSGQPGLVPLGKRIDFKLITAPVYYNPTYAQATATHPDGATFQEWLTAVSENRGGEREVNEVATTWARQLPGDARPFLLLSKSAENRKAWKTALDNLDIAARLDPVNPAVRQSRVRLNMATAARHFKNKKTHLVEKDLDVLAADGAMKTDDRPALLEVSRACLAVLKGDAGEANRLFAAMTEKYGPALAGALLASAALTFGLATNPALPDGPDGFPKKYDVAEVITAVVRMTPIFQQRLLEMRVPLLWSETIRLEAAKRPCPIPQGRLLQLCQFAMGVENPHLRFAISAALLQVADRPAVTARAMLLRAQSFIPHGIWRKLESLAVANFLLGQSNDDSMKAEISALIDELEDYHANEYRRAQQVTPEIAAKVIEFEKKTVTFPVSDSALNDHLVLFELEPNSPFDFGPDEEDEDDDFDKDLFPGGGIGGKAMSELLKRLTEKLGRQATVADLEELTRETLGLDLGNSGRKKKKKN